MILIVDDHLDNCGLLLKVLALRKLPAECVESGEAALAWVRARVPGVVVMDEMMPGLSGRETVRLMREIPGLASTPVIFYTGSNLDPAEVEDLGAVGFFRKGSSDVMEVLNTIENAYRLGGATGPARVSVAWRDAAGVHTTSMSLSPGWHDLVLR